MKRFRKLLSAVLALTMILSTLIIIPATVHAETETGAAVVPAGTTYSLTTDLTSATQGQFRFIYGPARGGHIYYCNIDKTQGATYTVPGENNTLNTTDGRRVFYVDETTGMIRADVVASDSGDIVPVIVFEAPEAGNYAFTIKHNTPSSTGGAPFIGYRVMNQSGAEDWGNATGLTQSETVTLKKGETIGIYSRGWSNCVYEVSEFTVEYRGYTLADDPAAGTKYSVFSAEGVNTTDFTYGQINRTATDFVNGVEAIDTEVTGDAYWGGTTGITGLGVAETTVPLVYVNEGTYGLQVNRDKKTVIYFEAPTCGEYVINFLINVLEPTTKSPTFGQQELWNRSATTVYKEGDDGSYTAIKVGPQNDLMFIFAGAGNSYLSGDTVAKRTITLEKGQSIAIAISSYDNLTYTVSDISLTLKKPIHLVNNWTADEEGHWQTCTTCGEDVVAKTAHTGETSCTVCGWGADYTATVSTTAQAIITPTTTIPVKVTLGGDQVSFASAEFVFTYDPEYVSFTSAPDGYEVDDDGNGTVAITVYGADKVTADTTVEAVFTANNVTESTTITLVSAALSTKERAEILDLKPAVLDVTAVTVKIANEYDVTLPEHFEGNEKAFDNEAYSFKKQDTNYNYENIVVKVGDVALEAEKVTYDDATGTWTVAADAVTGAITVTATVTGKYWDVALGDGSADLGSGELGEDKAQYMTPYVFYLKENVPATTTAGYNYTLTYIKVGGVELPASAYEIDAENDRKITISGAAITGDVEIMVTETVVDIAAYSVTFTGANIATGNASATIGQDYTFTTTPDDRFVYTITYTVGGVDKGTLTAVEGVYTIPSANVTGEIVINITATVPTDDVVITPYLTLNGAEMFLIVNNVTKLEDGRTYFINGNKMFWSDKYNAYCYLAVVEGEGSTSDDIAVELTIVTGDNAVLDYNYDVNKSGKVDINDAQLVYNMYSDAYADITESVTVEKFLLADVAGGESTNDKQITTADATAIVTYIFENN